MMTSPVPRVSDAAATRAWSSRAAAGLRRKPISHVPQDGGHHDKLFTLARRSTPGVWSHRKRDHATRIGADLPDQTRAVGGRIPARWGRRHRCARGLGQAGPRSWAASQRREPSRFSGPYWNPEREARRAGRLYTACWSDDGNRREQDPSAVSKDMLVERFQGFTSEVLMHPVHELGGR